MGSKRTPREQGTLALGFLQDDRPPPSARGSDTSEAAADAMKESVSSLRTRVLRWFAAHGPAADQQMMDATGLSHKTGVPRRWELVNRGWVEDTGERTVIRTGRKAVLWAVTEAGRSALAEIDGRH